MSSTAILTESKSDSLQYLAVLSLKRISISVCKGVLAFFNPPPPYVKTFSVHKVSENCDFLNPPPPTPMSLGNIKMVPYLNKVV